MPTSMPEVLLHAVQVGPDAAAAVVPPAPAQFDATVDRAAVVVDLAAGSCSCLDFKHREFVCKHMFCALRMPKKPLTSMPVQVWRAAHLAIDTEAVDAYSYVKQPGAAKPEGTGTDVDA